RLFVAAEAAEQAGARFEGLEHVESRNAAARPVCDVAIDRQDDRRPIERIHELGRDNADDAAMPALSAHDQNRSRSDFGIALDDLLGLGEDVLILLPA